MHYKCSGVTTTSSGGFTGEIFNKGGHAIRVWSDHDFTFYPLQAGLPFWFVLEEDKKTV